MKSFYITEFFQKISCPIFFVGLILNCSISFCKYRITSSNVRFFLVFFRLFTRTILLLQQNIILPTESDFHWGIYTDIKKKKLCSEMSNANPHNGSSIIYISFLFALKQRWSHYNSNEFLMLSWPLYIESIWLLPFTFLFRIEQYNKNFNSTAIRWISLHLYSQSQTATKTINFYIIFAEIEGF